MVTTLTNFQRQGLSSRTKVTILKFASFVRYISWSQALIPACHRGHTLTNIHLSSSPLHIIILGTVRRSRIPPHRDSILVNVVVVYLLEVLQKVFKKRRGWWLPIKQFLMYCLPSVSVEILTMLYAECLWAPMRWLFVLCLYNLPSTWWRTSLYFPQSLSAPYWGRYIYLACLYLNIDATYNIILTLFHKVLLTRVVLCAALSVILTVLLFVFLSYCIELCNMRS